MAGYRVREGGKGGWEGGKEGSEGAIREVC